MVKVNTVLIFLCVLFFSCNDLKNDETAFDSIKNDLLMRSGVLCELKPDTGPCKAAIPRYYFEEKSQKCKQFIWGGCNGTVPFETMNECINACE